MLSIPSAHTLAHTGKQVQLLVALHCRRSIDVRWLQASMIRMMTSTIVAVLRRVLRFCRHTGPGMPS
jgi:hypothetical protein